MIEIPGVRINSDGGVPEFPEKARALRIIPDVSGDGTAALCDTLHFLKRASRFGDVIQTKTAHGGIEAGVWKRNCRGVGKLEGDSRMRAMLAGKLNLCWRSVNAHDACRRAEFCYSLSYDTAPAADIKPSGAR